MKNESKKTVVEKKDLQTQKQGTVGGQKAPVDTKKLVGVKQEPKGVTLSMMAAGFAKKKNAYDKLRAALEKRLESLKKGIDRFQLLVTQIEAKLANMVPPNGNAALIQPLAKELLTLFPGFSYEVFGPSGLADAVTISFYPKDASAENRLSGEKCKSITIITKMPQGGIGVRDFSRDTHSHAPGSIGYASGLNHPTLTAPEDAQVKWFAQYVK